MERCDLCNCTNCDCDSFDDYDSDGDNCVADETILLDYGDVQEWPEDYRF
jgi:hypothetical protein